MAEPSRLGLHHVQRQDAGATSHEGPVKVEAASIRLPSMDPRPDAAATLPPTLRGTESSPPHEGKRPTSGIQPLLYLRVGLIPPPAAVFLAENVEAPRQQKRRAPFGSHALDEDLSGGN